jgi:hypothetical protein
MAVAGIVVEQVGQQGVYRGCPGARGAADRVADADDRRQVPAAKRRFFSIHPHSVPVSRRTVPAPCHHEEWSIS